MMGIPTSHEFVENQQSKKDIETEFTRKWNFENDECGRRDLNPSSNLGKVE